MIFLFAIGNCQEKMIEIDFNKSEYELVAKSEVSKRYLLTKEF
jgi:hypothetical protein